MLGGCADPFESSINIPKALRELQKWSKNTNKQKKKKSQDGIPAKQRQGWELGNNQLHKLGVWQDWKGRDVTDRASPGSRKVGISWKEAHGKRMEDLQCCAKRLFNLGRILQLCQGCC